MAIPVSAAIADFATTPTAEVGTIVWSTTESDLVRWNGTNWRLINPVKIKRLPGDVVNNNAVANTLQDVTGLSFPVVSGGVYIFNFFITYTSAITTTGSRWTLNGPAFTRLNYRSEYTLTATTFTTNHGLSAYSLPAASNASSVVASNIAKIEGIIIPSAAGDVIARFASEVLSSAITAIAIGSYVQYSRIA